MRNELSPREENRKKIMNYCGNSKPYIYVSFHQEDQDTALRLLDRLSGEGVLFCACRKTVNKKEKKHIEGAFAVLLFVSKKQYATESFKKTVDFAIQSNKNILTVYLDDVSTDSWGKMQLDSSQALFRNRFEEEDSFFDKLKEAQIFRGMKVTSAQKKFRRNTALGAMLVPVLSAALIFGLVIYPLMIVPSYAEEKALESFGLEGLTKEELEKITEINIIGNQVFTGVSDLGVSPVNENGLIEYRVNYQNGSSSQGFTERGSISDLSDLSKCPNLQVLRICGNSISDLTPLAGLEKLQRIVLEENPIVSLNGLENLENVWELSVNSTDVTSLTPIENYENLKILCIEYTPVSELPETGFLHNIEYLNVDSSLVTSIPSLGSAESLQFSAKRLPDTLEDYSFMKEMQFIRSFVVDNADIEELEPYLSGKEFYCFIDAGMNPETLSDLNWLNIQAGGYLDICHSEQLISLEGLEHFEGIGTLVIKGCLSIEDLSPLLSMQGLEKLVVSTPMKEQVEVQLKGAQFSIEYNDD